MQARAATCAGPSRPSSDVCDLAAAERGTPAKMKVPGSTRQQEACPVVYEAPAVGNAPGGPVFFFFFSDGGVIILMRKVSM